MVRSLWSGVQGLYVHQKEMDVIGNNISNVNTTSFKAQKTTFSDLLYQNTKRAYGATGNSGGTNAKQVGLGAVTSSIMTSITKQGSIQTTDAPFDMAISGDSFFVVATTDEDITNNPAAEMDDISYTRDGSFTVDENGYLVTRGEGRYVLGTLYEGAMSDEIGPMQVLPVDVNDPTKPIAQYPSEPTSIATITGKISRIDPKLSGVGRAVEVETYGTDGEKYTTRFRLTDAGDDDPTTYTLKIEGIYDKDHNLITEEGDDGKTYPSLPSVTEYSLEFTPEKDPEDESKTIWALYVNGNRATGDNGYRPQIEGTGAAENLGSFSLDLSGLTNYAPQNSTVIKDSDIETYRGKLNEETGEYDGSGFPAGDMNGVSVDKNGTVTRLYNNGQTEVIGQIVVGEFANASGLEKIGDNLYAESNNSGAANIFVYGHPEYNVDGVNREGSITVGALEMSNVDLAGEFTDMITAQRGFQANSKIITTSDEMIQTVRDMKR